MFKYEYNLETNATPEALFRLYSDVSTWPQWDASIEKMELSGPFAPGSQGVMTLYGQGPLPFTLTAVQPNVGFSDETPIPDAGIIVHFTHILILIAAGRTRITHRVTITGPAAEVVGPQIGPAITADIPQTVAALAELALTLAVKER